MSFESALGRLLRPVRAGERRLLLKFDSRPDLTAIAAAMAGSVLARARLTGVYERL
ncbi:MAG TPA: hypothetical protein VJY34_06605 [Roseiarcus sp.]|nr:hypothetical protein [Roseiarcus sp.]